MTKTNFENLNDEEKELLMAAEKALQNSYNPYNNQTKVGAAVRLSSGEIIIGANMANISSTVNLCAERAVLATANAQGRRDIKIMALIGTDIDGVIEKPIMPCGLCRQFMEEFISINKTDIQFICSNSAKTEIIKTSLEELLPLPYSN